MPPYGESSLTSFLSITHFRPLRLPYPKLLERKKKGSPNIFLIENYYYLSIPKAPGTETRNVFPKFTLIFKFYPNFYFFPILNFTQFLNLPNFEVYQILNFTRKITKSVLLDNFSFYLRSPWLH